MNHIDAHIHIDFYSDINKTIKDIITNRVTSIFVTHLPELYKKYYEQIRFINTIHLALGYHPNIINEYAFNYDLFKKLSKTTSFIGEVGLDYAIARSDRARNKQKNVFDTICEISQDHIISIHSRKAEKDVLSILTKNNIKHAIFHWYTGELEFVDEILKNGYYFSINPAMIKSSNGRTILKNISLNRILVETDGPFIKFKGEIIKSKHLEDIYKDFAEFYSLEYREFRNIVENNFRKLLTAHNLTVHDNL